MSDLALSLVDALADKVVAKGGETAVWEAVDDILPRLDNAEKCIDAGVERIVEAARLAATRLDAVAEKVPTRETDATSIWALRAAAAAIRGANFMVRGPRINTQFAAATWWGGRLRAAPSLQLPACAIGIAASADTIFVLAQSLTETSTIFQFDAASGAQKADLSVPLARGVSATLDGTLYITEQNSSVQIFSPSSSTGPDTLHRVIFPCDRPRVAVSPDGEHVFVAVTDWVRVDHYGARLANPRKTILPASTQTPGIALSLHPTRDGSRVGLLTMECALSRRLRVINTVTGKVTIVCSGVASQEPHGVTAVEDPDFGALFAVSSCRGISLLDFEGRVVDHAASPVGWPMSLLAACGRRIFAGTPTSRVVQVFEF